jgi:hypothetical protein
MPIKHKKNRVEKKAIAAAKKLESIPEPSKEEIIRIYKEGMREAERLQRLLKPEWFVKDTDKPGKKLKKK